MPLFTNSLAAVLPISIRRLNYLSPLKQGDSNQAIIFTAPTPDLSIYILSRN